MKNLNENWQKSAQNWWGHQEKTRTLSFQYFRFCNQERKTHISLKELHQYVLVWILDIALVSLSTSSQSRVMKSLRKFPGGWINIWRRKNVKGDISFIIEQQVNSFKPDIPQLYTKWHKVYTVLPASLYRSTYTVFA